MSTVMTWFTPATSSIPAISLAAIGFLFSGCLWSPLEHGDLAYSLDLFDCRIIICLFTDKCNECNAFIVHIDLLSLCLSKKWINANVFDNKKCVLFWPDVL